MRCCISRGEEETLFGLDSCGDMLVPGFWKERWYTASYGLKPLDFEHFIHSHSGTRVCNRHLW